MTQTVISTSSVLPLNMPTPRDFFRLFLELWELQKAMVALLNFFGLFDIGRHRTKKHRSVQ